MGKTCLLQAYTRGGFPSARPPPTVQDTYTVDFQVGGVVQRLALWDTGGSEEQAGSRILPCTEASVGLKFLSCDPVDVVLVCFSLANDTSAQNAVDVWVPLLSSLQPGVPVLLVATQTDLRGQPGTLSRMERGPGTRRSLQRAAGASGYVECSALTGAGVKDVFDSAILAVLQPRSKEPERELLRDRANSSLRSLRRSSRSLRSSLSRQTSRSRTSLREAGLRSELGFGFVDRLRAWCRSRLRIRGRSSSLSSLREAGRRCELGLGVVDMVNAWGGSMWGSSAWAARETEIW